MDTEEFNEESAIEAGIKAELLLNNPIFLSAVEEVHRDIITRWLTTETGESCERERLYNMSLALRSVINTLNSYVTVKEQISRTRSDMETYND